MIGRSLGETKKKTSLIKRLKLRTTWPLLLMLVFPIVFLILFHYVPLFGIRLAFVRFNPRKGIWGSPYVGTKYFAQLFSTLKFWTILKNTLIISIEKIIVTMFFSVSFALILSGFKWKFGSKMFQSIMLFPWFISWIILSTIFLNVFSSEGAVNAALSALGMRNVSFFTNQMAFHWLVIFSSAWKGMGYNMVILITAINGIDSGLYEAAKIDGANRARQTWHVTLPGIRPMMILLLILSLGSILNAGFDQIYTLYNSALYESAEIIDTYVYKIGLQSAQYSLGTATGIFKSAVGAVLMIISYFLASKLANYRVF